MNFRLPCLLSVALLTLSGLAVGASPTLPKEGFCPSGYHPEGRYCVGNHGADAPAAIPKEGPCPSGYHPEGRYCVGNRR